MSRGFLLLLFSSSAAVFAGTWFFTGSAQSPQAQPAVAERSAAASGVAFVSSCEEAHAKGLGPFYAGEAGYSAELDPDGDGLACPPA